MLLVFYKVDVLTILIGTHIILTSALLQMFSNRFTGVLRIIGKLKSTFPERASQDFVLLVMAAEIIVVVHFFVAGLAKNHSIVESLTPFSYVFCVQSPLTGLALVGQVIHTVQKAHSADQVLANLALFNIIISANYLAGRAESLPNHIGL